MYQRRTGFMGVLLACLPLACTGEIGDGPAANQRPGSRSGPETPRGGVGGTTGGGADLDPGRVTLRRLNRTEYDNTLRDLLGTTLRPATAFEPDPTGFGFDNNGDVQTLTTLQIEQYQAAAEAVVAEVTAGGLDR